MEKTGSQKTPGSIKNKQRTRPLTDDLDELARLLADLDAQARRIVDYLTSLWPHKGKPPKDFWESILKEASWNQIDNLVKNLLDVVEGSPILDKETKKRFKAKVKEEFWSSLSECRLLVSLPEGGRGPGRPSFEEPQDMFVALVLLILNRAPSNIKPTYDFLREYLWVLYPGERLSLSSFKRLVYKCKARAKREDGMQHYPLVRVVLYMIETKSLPE